MKTLVRIGLAALVSSCFIPLALAEIEPASPTPRDVVKVTADFPGTGGCSLKESVSVGKPGADGKTPIVVLEAGEGACDMMLMPGTKTVSLGKLAAGTYVITAANDQYEVTVGSPGSVKVLKSGPAAAKPAPAKKPKALPVKKRPAKKKIAK